MTDEPDMFATSDDLERRWHKLTDEELEKADTHLADVTDYIKERSPNWRRLLDERPRLLTKITCDIVRRIMQADPYDIPGGITQMNQTTGSFSEQYSFGAPPATSGCATTRNASSASTRNARSASTWQRGRRPSGNHRNLARPAHHRHGRQPHPRQARPRRHIPGAGRTKLHHRPDRGKRQSTNHRIHDPYPRQPATGIQTTDLIKVRGILLPVKGKPQVWNNIHGRHIGDVITVGERKG